MENKIHLFLAIDFSLIPMSIGIGHEMTDMIFNHADAERLSVKTSVLHPRRVYSTNCHPDGVITTEVSKFRD